MSSKNWGKLEGFPPEERQPKSWYRWSTRVWVTALCNEISWVDTFWDSMFLRRTIQRSLWRVPRNKTSTGKSQVAHYTSPLYSWMHASPTRTWMKCHPQDRLSCLAAWDWESYNGHLTVITSAYPAPYGNAPDSNNLSVVMWTLPGGGY